MITHIEKLQYENEELKEHILKLKSRIKLMRLMEKENIEGIKKIKQEIESLGDIND
jgi:hypothetical protein